MDIVFEVKTIIIELKFCFCSGNDYIVYNDYLFEPSAALIMEQLLPRYIEVEFYRALVEAKASEHGSRMTAMKNATDNAEELVDNLTLSANRARQEQISKELAEIVGGAAALRG